MAPPDFTLPSDDGAELRFDAEFRAAGLSLLFFYRGHW